MTQFEQFEKDFGETVERLGLKRGAKCAKIVMTFIDEDDTTAEIAAVRKGFDERLKSAEDD